MQQQEKAKTSVVAAKKRLAAAREKTAKCIASLNALSGGPRHLHKVIVAAKRQQRQLLSQIFTLSRIEAKEIEDDDDSSD